MFRMTGALAVLLLAATAAPARPFEATATPAETAAHNALLNAPLPPAEAAFKSHVMFLAADAMAGREAGSHEFDIAAEYVASQFYEAGLRPAGDNGGYFQSVPLVSFRPADDGSFGWAPRGGAALTLKPGEDYIAGADPSAATTSVSAPVVFVGWGIVAPQFGRDDYRGVDVRGKIVAVLPGAPDRYPGEERAHFGSPATKVATAAIRGAVGVVMIEAGSGRGLDGRGLAANARPRWTWGNGDGTGHPGSPGTPNLGTITEAGADKLFAGAATNWDKLAPFSANSDAKFKPEQLPGTLSITLHTSMTTLPSRNVVGMIPGTDPALKDQLVVLSGHLDHLGVGRADARGDTINNGAEDDGVGIATLIEEARRFKESGQAPRRTLVFLAVTAEEKGLIGSDYFAHHATLPDKTIVADVNLDMPVLTYRFEDVVAFGADRSTIGPIVHKVASDMGLAFSPDPIPEEGIFVRSDHYRFVQQGVPSVFIWPGPNGPGLAATRSFLATHYHQPSDEVVQDPPLLWDQGVRFVDLNYRIARAIADGDQRPAWNKGDFFGTLYNGYGAK